MEASNVAQHQPPRMMVSGNECIEPFVKIVAAAFSKDPFTRLFISEADHMQPGAEISMERLVEHFRPHVIKNVSTGAEIAETCDWAAASMWFPPNAEKSPIENSLIPGSAMSEFVAESRALKSRHLGGRQHWYLNILCRNPDRKEPGVIRALVEPYLHDARRQGVPAWLEATNVHARDVYTHLGFRIAETVRIQEGRANEKGDAEDGGEGIPLYGMIYEPMGE